MAYTDAELESGLAAWQGRQRSAAGLLPFGGGSGSAIDLEALRRYLATDGANATNLGAKLQMLQAAGDPRLAQTARAVLADPAALSNLTDLYRSQDGRYADQRINASTASTAEALGLAEAEQQAAAEAQAPAKALDALEEQRKKSIADLLGLRDQDPYDVNNQAGRSNFDRVSGQVLTNQQIQGLGYERPIQADASARGMLQAGTTGAKMAATEGALTAGLIGTQARLGQDFLDKSTNFKTRINEALFGAGMDPSLTNMRLGQLNTEAGRDLQASQFDRSLEAQTAQQEFSRQQADDARNASGLSNFATALGTAGGALLAGPAGAAVGGAATKALTDFAGSIAQPAPQARPAAQPTNPYQSDPAKPKTYGLASISDGALQGYGTPTNSMRPNSTAPSLRWPKAGGKASWA